MAVIALDLGGTKIAGALMNEDGKILYPHRNLLNGRSGGEVGTLIADNVRLLVERARYHRINVEAVGACIPGIVDPETGIVWAPNIPGWEKFPLRSVIRRALGTGHEETPILIDNDRICYVYGSKWKGASRDCRNVVFMAVGTGIGAGIVIDGHPLHGASNIIGAAGWMALDAPWTEAYGPAGCFEYYASGAGICARAKDMVRADKQYRGPLRQKPISRITTGDVFQAYDGGDPIATTVIRKAVQMWGMAAANIVRLLNPELIVWGGGVFGPAQALIPDIYREALKWAQPISIRQVRFIPSEMKGPAGILGAAYIAINRDKI